MSDNPGELSIDVTEGNPVHRFKIKEAQRLFRECELEAANGQN
jgi:hypothetical protein